MKLVALSLVVGTATAFSPGAPLNLARPAVAHARPSEAVMMPKFLSEYIPQSTHKNRSSLEASLQTVHHAKAQLLHIVY